MYYIGVDGGGTKTGFKLFDEHLNCVDQIVLPSVHFSLVTDLQMKNILNQGIEHLIKRNNVKHYQVALGLAGYGNVLAIRQRIEKVVSTIDCIGYLGNDIEVGITGALETGEGIIVVSGTGSIALSNHHNHEVRVGGWGYHLGDDGSAYDIGKKTLNIFTKQADGRIAKSPLYDIIMKENNLDNPYQIIDLVNSAKNKRQFIANYAKYASKAALVDDQYALNIFQQAGDELALMINSLAWSCDEQINCAYLGGLFNTGALLLDAINKKLNKNIKMIKPKHCAEYGAVARMLMIRKD